MISIELLQAVAVTAELCGRVFSEPAARMFVQDLAVYDEEQIIKALARCRREVRGALTVQDVVSRIDDGRPGPEEAWAMIPKDEHKSAVWTDEMREAYAIAAPLLQEGEEIPARMAFKESYIRILSEARNGGVKVRWEASLGHDKSHREQTLAKAVELGRISAESVAGLLPAPASIHVAAQVVGLLTGSGESFIPPQELRRRIADFREKLARKEFE